MGKIGGGFEDAMGTRAAAMDNAFRNALGIESTEFLKRVRVLQENRACPSGRLAVLIGSDSVACLAGEVVRVGGCQEGGGGDEGEEWQKNALGDHGGCDVGQCEWSTMGSDRRSNVKSKGDD